MWIWYYSPSNTCNTTRAWNTHSIKHKSLQYKMHQEILRLEWCTGFKTWVQYPVQHTEIFNLLLICRLVLSTLLTNLGGESVGYYCARDNIVGDLGNILLILRCLYDNVLCDGHMVMRHWICDLAPWCTSRDLSCDGYCGSLLKDVA